MGASRISVCIIRTKRRRGGRPNEITPYVGCSRRAPFRFRFRTAPSTNANDPPALELKSVSVGTELSVVQEGIPSAIPVEECYLGWQESLTLLTQLVEAEIKEWAPKFA